MRINKTIIALLPLWLAISAFSQSVEKGFVKEYQGENAKTPLAGVELSIVGAPSTVSDEQGRYELKFAKLKPGQNININEIYKSGYVIFNKSQLESWRISNDQTPFVIVMCKESTFRETKSYYDNIIRKTYEKEYAYQKELAKQLATDNENLKTRLKQIEEDYEEKISNINTYVELFARIDRNEIDSTRAQALRLMESGHITEAIKLYDQINLTEKAEEQIRKLHAGQDAQQAAQQLVNDSYQDLLALIETAKEKIGIYKMGGSKYDKKRNTLTRQLLDWYAELNNAMDGRFNEDYGQWICTYADYTKTWDERLIYYQQAAELPSWNGLCNLANLQMMMAFANTGFVEASRDGFQKALAMNPPDSIQTEIQQKLDQFPDFYVALSTGDTVYLKCNDDHESATVWPRTPYCGNIVNGTVELPATVSHNGKSYQITAIGEKAFYRNLNLHKMILPESVQMIGDNAFSHSPLDTLVVGKNLKTVGRYSLPVQTCVIAPKKTTKTQWYFNHEHRRDSLSQVEQDPQLRELTANMRNSSSPNEENNAKHAYLLRCVHIVQDVSKSELQRIPGGFKAVEYEELVSIGIITVQAVIKGKTIEQLEKYDDKYMSTVVKWSIRNELRHRYEWYAWLTGNYLKDDEERIYNKEDKQYYLRNFVAIIQRVAQLYYDNQNDDPDYYIEYEELVAVGVLGIQAMTKDRSVQELSLYNDAYIEQVVKWTIFHEMPLRHEWFNDKYLESWSKL